MFVRPPPPSTKIIKWVPKIIRYKPFFFHEHHNQLANLKIMRTRTLQTFTIIKKDY